MIYDRSYVTRDGPPESKEVLYFNTLQWPHLWCWERTWARNPLLEFQISRTFKIRSRSRDCDRHFKTTWELTENLREFYHTFTNIFFIIKPYNIVNLFPNTMNCNSEVFIKINYKKCQVWSEFNIKKNFFIAIILNANIKNKWFKFSSHNLRFDLNNCLTVSEKFMHFFKCSICRVACFLYMWSQYLHLKEALFCLSIILKTKFQTIFFFFHFYCARYTNFQNKAFIENNWKLEPLRKNIFKFS